MQAGILLVLVGASAAAGNLAPSLWEKRDAAGAFELAIRAANDSKRSEQDRTMGHEVLAREIERVIQLWVQRIEDDQGGLRSDARNRLIAVALTCVRPLHELERSGGDAASSATRILKAIREAL